VTTEFTVVVPTTGRYTLRVLLEALAAGRGPVPAEVIVVDDRPRGGSLPLPEISLPLRTIRSGGRGPAAARNIGWRHAETEWIAFLDDDVCPGTNWPAELRADLSGLPADVGASQGRIVVPPPANRRPTDDERDTAELATAKWITADMTYRRRALATVGGFDERFPRAYREDADLAERVRRAGFRLVTGSRTTVHPARRGSFLASVRAQKGNADNALLRRKYGRGWRRLIGEGPGRLGTHAVTTLAGATALALAPANRRTALGFAMLWAALTAEFAIRRIRPGPRTGAEIARMTVTSALIPPAACWHRARGELVARRNPAPPAALLFDRDDTLITDVPYLADAARVRPVPGAAVALDRLRAAGIPVGVVSNQSGVARGLISPEQLAEVNARVDELLGPFGTWQVCMHGDDDGCACRKPRPGLVRRAAEALGVPVAGCVVVGDTGADVDAAITAGAAAILVPTEHTRPEEIVHARRAARVAEDLGEAVAFALGDMS
jgi:histidinol-phosphate phosphatase family protein